MIHALGINAKVLGLVQGNTTRWGSDYNTWTRAFDTREPLEEFVASAIRRNKNREHDGLPSCLQHDELSVAGWDT